MIHCVENVHTSMGIHHHIVPVMQHTAHTVESGTHLDGITTVVAADLGVLGVEIILLGVMIMWTPVNTVSTITQQSPIVHSGTRSS